MGGFLKSSFRMNKRFEDGWMDEWRMVCFTNLPGRESSVLRNDGCMDPFSKSSSNMSKRA